MKNDDFRKELVNAARETMENVRTRADLKGKADLFEIFSVLEETIKALAPAKPATLMITPKDQISPDVGHEFPHEIVIFLNTGAAKKPVFIDRFYLRADGAYPVVGYYPNDQVVPLGDKVALQQRVMVLLAVPHSPLIKFLMSE